MGEVYNIFCSGRVNPPQDHAIAAAGTAQQTLRIEIGSGPNDIVNGEDALPGKFIILYRSRHLLDDDVGINAQDLIAQAVGKTIEIATDLLPVSSVSGEEFAIRELLTNLIFNAVDAMPEGGTITLGTMLDGRAVRLSVSDTGTGMTEETRRRCLEPFYTTKGTTGTGLGLAMVQGIVQRHNGTVDVESQFGHGTTFIIRLPLQKGTQPPSVPPLEVPALTRSRHVLVVDDEPLLRAIAETYLTEDGHKVETAPTGAVALAQLKTSKFDLVITDKAMPEMNGEQLAAAIHQIVPGLPVIMMTGFGDLMKVTGEMPPYISEILSKPLTQASLRAAMAKVVGVN